MSKIIPTPALTGVIAPAALAGGDHVDATNALLEGEEGRGGACFLATGDGLSSSRTDGAMAVEGILGGVDILASVGSRDAWVLFDVGDAGRGDDEDGPATA